ncbi:MAG: hypothetical protein ABI707_11270 [Ferruginibacter sp.]
MNWQQVPREEVPGLKFSLVRTEDGGLKFLPGALELEKICHYPKK